MNTIQTMANLTNSDLIGRVAIPAIVTKQGTRVVYQMNLMFRQVTNLFDHTETMPQNANADIIDIKTLRNRYLRPDKVEDLVTYVYENLDSYILPPISAISDKPFSFQPYNEQEILENLGEEFNLVKFPNRIEEVLEASEGMLQGLLIFKESEFNVEILDGNHRVAAIHKLVTRGKEFKTLRIGTQIFVEDNLKRTQQAFVDMNTSTPIDKTIITLFSSRDALSTAAKETIGDNPNFQIKEFLSNSNDYIGFDAINDSITRNSNAVISLNMVKNMIVKFAFGSSGTPKKFNSTYDIKAEDYQELLKDFSIFMQTVFDNMAPYDEIKVRGTGAIPKLREEYISLTGAGLYLIATIGYYGRKNKMDLRSVATSLSNINWKRTINEEANQLFRTGILSEQGKISNNRNAIQSTLEELAKNLHINIRD